MHTATPSFSQTASQQKRYRQQYEQAVKQFCDARAREEAKQIARLREMLLNDYPSEK